METINLLNGEDFIPKINFTGKIVGFDMAASESHGDMTSIIISKLCQGQRDRKLIYTQGIRGIGKTHELIKYAKACNYIVVVMSEIQAKSLRKEYNYEKIYGQGDSNLRGHRDFVIDEQVKLRGYISENLVITGFTVEQNIPTIEKAETEPYGGIIGSLRNDAVGLCDKLSKGCNQSDYKMLINNLKSTMELIQYLEIKDKTNIEFTFGQVVDYIGRNLEQYTPETQKLIMDILAGTKNLSDVIKIHGTIKG